MIAGFQLFNGLVLDTLEIKFFFHKKTVLAKLILYSLLTQFNLHPQLTLQNLSGGTRFKCYPGPFSSVSYNYDMVTKILLAYTHIFLTQTHTTMYKS